MKRVISLFLTLVMVVGIISGMPVNVSATNSMVENAINWAIGIANDNNYGYSQVNRYGNPDYDCSSLVSTAFHNAGFNVACELNTRTMKDAFINAGFIWIPASQISGFPSSCANLQRGDILLASGHTELYIGNGKNVGAHMDYNGIPGGIGGGSTWSSGYNAYRYGADEIDVCNYWNDNWLGVLRYGDAYTEPPTEAWIWSDKTTVAVGEEVKFNYNAKNATNFVLGIWHNGNHSVVDVGINDWHTMIFSEAGVYAVHAACYNPKGYMDTSEIYIYVYDNIPTNAIISSDKTCVQKGENVTFTFGADCATNYVVGIYDYKGEPVIADVGASKTFTCNFANKGTYYVHTACYNLYGHIDTSEIEINVYDTSPSAPENLYSDKTLYSSDEYITFTWNKVKIASEYWVYMWKDGVELYGTSVGNNTTFTSAPTSPGKYTLIVSAGNNLGYSNSSCKFDFTVYDPNEKFTITYNANGGSGAPTSQTKTYGQTLTLSSTKPTRSGYTFLGWSTSSTATKATYSAGGSFTTDANTTLYAVWQKNHSHSYTSTVTKAPTCIESGVKTFKCSCGASYTQTISATGHTQSDWLTDYPATVYKSGTKHKECTECGAILETATIAQLKCSKPTLSAVSNTTSGVKVSWSKVSGADRYRVYRKTSSSGWTCLNSKVTSTSYTDKTAKSGTKYYYTVRAENEAGLSSYNTTGLSIKRLSTPKLSKTENTTSGVKITWSKVTGASGYYVYRKTSGSGWKQIGKTTKTYYTDTTAKSGTTYYYTVRAYSGSVKSYYNTDGLKIKHLADPTLKTPSSTKSGVSLKWTKTTGAQGYIIYRKEGSGSYKKLKTEKGVSNLSYVDKSAKKGKKYTYKVRAYYSKTYSAYSNAKTIKDKY